MKLLSSLFVFLLCALLFVQCDKEPSLTGPDSEYEALYPPSHVNPTGLGYTVYQASAFCGGHQIQVWAPTMEVCECLYDDFVNECQGELTNVVLCEKKTSQYPPLTETCN
jgi:hypothetical protein